jgi:hypothetical protein
VQDASKLKASQPRCGIARSFAKRCGAGAAAGYEAIGGRKTPTGEPSIRRQGDSKSQLRAGRESTIASVALATKRWSKDGGAALDGLRGGGASGTELQKGLEPLLESWSRWFSLVDLFDVER